MHGGFENLKHKLLPKNGQESNCPLEDFHKPLKSLVH
jgi:hypothetical protein